MKHFQIAHDYASFYDDYYKNSCPTLKMAQYKDMVRRILIYINMLEIRDTIILDITVCMKLNKMRKGVWL